MRILPQIIFARMTLKSLQEIIIAGYGEIDIIAKNSEFIAFVEVKARNEKALERPAAAVTSAKRRKIIQTALIFLSEFEYDLQPRFDVCEITIDNRTNMLIELNYIENAFDTEGFL